MRRTAVLVLMILPLLLLGPESLRGDEPSATVKIGLVETITQGIPATWTQVAMRPFKALMEIQTGMSGEVVAGGDALTLAKYLQEDKIQVGVFHGHEFAWAKQKYPKLKVIALCVNKSQHTKVHLVVRSDSKAVSYADLRGKVISVPLMGRAVCRIYLERRCVKPGITPDTFFERVEKPLATDDSLEDLVNGDVAAAVVDTAGLAEFRKSSPASARRLRVLADSESFPCGVIAYCPGRLSEVKVRKFCVGLLSAPSTPRGRDTLRMLRLTAFEMPPANHDALLEIIARAYPAPAPAK